jgi:hypothetical protein
VDPRGRACIVVVPFAIHLGTRRQVALARIGRNSVQLAQEPSNEEGLILPDPLLAGLGRNRNVRLGARRRQADMPPSRRVTGIGSQSPSCGSSATTPSHQRTDGAAPPALTGCRSSPWRRVLSRPRRRKRQHRRTHPVREETSWQYERQCPQCVALMLLTTIARLRVVLFQSDRRSQAPQLRQSKHRR